MQSDPECSLLPLSHLSKTKNLTVDPNFTVNILTNPINRLNDVIQCLIDYKV